MDPDEYLRMTLGWVKAAFDEINKKVKPHRKRTYEEEVVREEELLVHASELAARISNIDEWLTKGGFLPRRWAETCNGGLLARALLAQEVYLKVFDAVESFEEDDIGTELSYLLGAILKGDQDGVEFFRDDDGHMNVLGVLQKTFDVCHPVWKYITVSQRY